MEVVAQNRGHGVKHAPDEYIELMTGNGVIRFALMTWFLVSMLYRSISAFRLRQDLFGRSKNPARKRLAGTALGRVGVHAAFEV